MKHLPERFSLTKTITLIRHCRPAVYEQYSLLSLLSGADFRCFIDIYNNCDLSVSEVPITLKNMVKDGDCFIASNLKRTKDSFKLLGINSFEITDLLNEAEIPNGIMMKLHMPLFCWLFLFRTLWYFGCNINCESFAEFKVRIKKAKIFIQKKVENNNKIIIMSHGFVNLQLEKELLLDNWVKLGRKNSSSFMSYKTYSRCY